MMSANKDKQPPFEIRTTRLDVVPPGDHLFSEMCTTVEIESDVGGENVKVSQSADVLENQQAILISSKEWPFVKKAIDQMVNQCRDYQLPND